MISFTFDDEMIDVALRANGWYDHWHSDNWVPASSKNPDWGGMSKKKAFESLLHSKNLIPRDKNEKCWSEK